MNTLNNFSHKLKVLWLAITLTLIVDNVSAEVARVIPDSQSNQSYAQKAPKVNNGAIEELIKAIESWKIEPQLDSEGNETFWNSWEIQGGKIDSYWLDDGISNISINNSTVKDSNLKVKIWK